MASVMAIVSKAVFEKEARGLAIGDVWATASYGSQNKTLAALDGGGDLYLVTVRPPETLTLVGILRAPKHSAAGWTAKANTTPIRDVHALRSKLTFSQGQPLPTEAGKLGMSLQTPRVLTDEAAALLAGGAATAEKISAKSNRAADAPPVKSAAKSRTAAKASRDDDDDDDAPPAKPAAKSRTAAKATRDDDDDDDAPVATPAKRGAKSGAADAKASAKPTGASTPESIRTVLATGRPADALPNLLELWRVEPSAQLATLIETVSAAARTDPPGLDGKSADALDAWRLLEKEREPVMLPVLLATLASAKSADAADRVMRLEGWMPDPRVDAALASWIDTPPFHATMTKPFYTQVFRLAREMGDPNQLAKLEAADVKLSRTIAPTMGDWLRAQLKKLLADIGPQLRAVPAATPASTELASAVGSLRSDTSSLDTLLAAVYADPAADGPRLVYADALSERGDVRGEFITIQCRLAEQPDDRELKKRETELLEDYGKQWLGELAPILMADFVFERGFLAACRVDDKRRKQALSLAGHPVWQTVQRFDGPIAIGLHPSMRALRSFTYDGWTEERSDDDGDFDQAQPPAWHDLLAGTRRPLTELSYRFGGDRTESALAALAECAALPDLTALEVHDDPHDTAALFAAPVLARLQGFGLRFDANQNDRWIATLAPLFAGAPTPQLTLEITHSGFHPTNVTLTRTATKSKRAYAAAVVELGARGRGNWSSTLVEEVIKLLRAVPGLRGVTIHQRKGMDPAGHTRLSGALKALGLDSWSIL